MEGFNRITLIGTVVTDGYLESEGKVSFLLNVKKPENDPRRTSITLPVETWVENDEIAKSITKGKILFLDGALVLRQIENGDVLVCVLADNVFMSR